VRSRPWRTLTTSKHREKIAGAPSVIILMTSHNHPPKGKSNKENEAQEKPSVPIVDIGMSSFLAIKCLLGLLLML
jgi:hypothetical protein